MATYLGDIPGGALAGPALTVASVASNGADAATTLPSWRAPQKVILDSVWWSPDTVAQATASATASYRQLKIVNGGQGAAGTVVLGSLNLTASLQSLATRAFTLSTAPTLAAGDVLIFSHLTVGGAQAEGTVLRAGTLYVQYRPTS